MSRRLKEHTSLVPLALFALGCLTGACTEPSPCSENERFDNGYCYPVDAAAPADAEATEAGMAGEAGSAFGVVCTTASNCTAPATFCAVDPSGPGTGFCTATGCEAQPGLCPSDWTCTDLEPQYHYPMHMCLPSQ